MTRGTCPGEVHRHEQTGRLLHDLLIRALLWEGSELPVFETKAALDRCKAGQFGFTADASAMVLTSGAATKATFVDGVVVHPFSGVMVEAAIGGQQFTYQAK